MKSRVRNLTCQAIAAREPSEALKQAEQEVENALTKELVADDGSAVFFHTPSQIAFDVQSEFTLVLSTAQQKFTISPSRGIYTYQRFDRNISTTQSVDVQKVQNLSSALSRLVYEANCEQIDEETD